MPWAITNASYNHQKDISGVTEIVEMKNRGHALTIDSGWRDVADAHAATASDRRTTPCNESVASSAERWRDRSTAELMRLS